MQSSSNKENNCDKLTGTKAIAKLQRRQSFSLSNCHIKMENSESGDDIGHTFLATDQAFMVNATLDDETDALNAEHTDDSNHDTDHPRAPLREQDRFLPIANVAKIMKRAIPDTGKIAKEARECVQECVSEFISFITSEASDRCHTEKRKTINGEDILYAMTTLGFDNYVEPLTLYLQKYREATKSDRNISNEIIYEDVNAENAYLVPDPLAISATEITTEASNTETVIYTYNNPIQQFQIN